MANLITLVGGENNVRMTNARFARQPIASVLSGWTTLRVAVRLKVSDTGGHIIAPHFFLGLCAGSTNIIGDPTTDHYLGYGDIADWTRSAATSVNYSGSVRGQTKVGTIYSNAGTALAPVFHVNRYKLLFVDITKGSPNYTVAIFHPNVASDVDATNANFQLQSVSVTPLLPNHGTATGSLAVSEVVNGTFTHACCSWDQLASTIDLAEFRVFKVA